MALQKKKFSKKIQKGVDKKVRRKLGFAKICIVHINSTQNNTILTGTDKNGSVIVTKSQGCVAKKRGKRSVGFGANMTGELIGSLLLEKGFAISQVRLKGFGSGREQALSGLHSSGLRIVEILDITKIPHNGCRPRKARRI
jgi:small subunit ribosomal protein S11